MAKDTLDFQPEELDFTPENTEKMPSTISEDITDVVRGGAQGVTLGFADELEGALKAAANAGASDETLRELYTKYRDVARQKYKQSEERSPYLSAAGNVAGGFLLPLGALKTASTGIARVGQIAKMGAKAGAATAAGTSEAETIPELSQDALTGGVIGAGLAGTLGSIGGLGRTLTKAAQRSPLESTVAGDIAVAYKAGAEEQKLTGQIGFKKTERNIKRELKKLVQTLDNQEQITGKEKEALLKSAEAKTKDYKEYLDLQKNSLQKLQEKNLTEPQRKAVQEQLNTIDDYLLGKKQEVTYKGQVEGPQETGHDKLVKKAIEVEGDAKALGAPVTTNIVEDADTGTLRLIKNEMDPATGEITPKIVAREQVTPPISVTPFEKTEVVRLGAKTNLAPSEADFLKRTLADLVDKANTSSDVSYFDELRQLQQGFSKNIRQQLEEQVPGLAEINKRYGAVKETKELLYGDPSASLKTEFESKLLNKIFQDIVSTAEETKAGSKAREKVGEAFKTFRKSLKPEQKMEMRNLQKGIQEQAARYDVSRQINREGLAAGSLLGNIKSKTLALANFVGRKKSEAVKTLSNATPEDYKNLAEQVRSMGSKSASALGDSLNRISENPSQSLKNALTFSIMQNPEYRKILGITEE